MIPPIVLEGADIMDCSICSVYFVETKLVLFCRVETGQHVKQLFSPAGLSALCSGSSHVPHCRDPRAEELYTTQTGEKHSTVRNTICPYQNLQTDLNKLFVLIIHFKGFYFGKHCLCDARDVAGEHYFK